MSQLRHAMLPEETHDERSRGDFIASLRSFAMGDLYPKIGRHFRNALEPAFAATQGRRPATTAEVRTLMEDCSIYTGFSLITRATQELLWDTVGETVERQLPALIAKSKSLLAEGNRLELDASLPVPGYTASVDIHVMPGGYHSEIADDDLYAGALYDRGVYLFAFGGLGPLNDELGVATAAAVKRQFPDWEPRHILDLGCGSGLSTLPLADAFKKASIDALDLGAPMLRYGAARAASLGYDVTFRQRDATQTRFPDGSFDLVTSTLLLHELPRQAILAVLRECYRLLRPGGVMVHHDLLRWPDEPFESFMMEWTTRHNNEPYERASGSLDFVKECAAVGFAPAEVFVVAQPGVYLEEVYQVSGIRGARKT